MSVIMSASNDSASSVDTGNSILRRGRHSLNIKGSSTNVTVATSLSRCGAKDKASIFSPVRWVSHIRLLRYVLSCSGLTDEGIPDSRKVRD